MTRDVSAPLTSSPRAVPRSPVEPQRFSNPLSNLPINRLGNEAYAGALRRARDSLRIKSDGDQSAPAPPPPPQSCSPDMGIRKVKARVDGIEEVKRKFMESGPVPFSFTGSAQIDGCQTPQYEWDFNDGNTWVGDSPAVTHAYERPGIYTARLTVKCASCQRVQQSDTVQVIVLAVGHVTEATHPANRTRNDVGVGEVVTIGVFPSDPEVSAQLFGGGELSGSAATELRFKAPEVGGKSTVQLQAPAMMPFDLTFAVWAPNHVTLTGIEDTKGTKGTKRFKGIQGIQALVGVPGAGKEARVALHALGAGNNERDVSFYNVQVMEGAALPEEIEGYFQSVPGLPGFVSSGQDWSDVLESNLAKKSFNAGFVNTGLKLRPPWTDGRFIYEIPWFYRLTGKQTPFLIEVVVREVEMEGPASEHEAGTVYISQSGLCARRSPGDVYWFCIPT